jgi:hypothetical protein
VKSKQQSMPDILVIAPTTADIYKVIIDGFRKYAPEVRTDFMSHSIPQYKYKSKADRLGNFFSKLFMNINIKEVYCRKIMEKRLAILKEKYDVIFVIRPDLLTNKELAILKSKTPNLIAYYWDTINFYPRKKEIIHLFDKVYSFDIQDCKNYGFERLTNFYYYEPAPEAIDKTVFCISQFDRKRYHFLNQIGKFLDENNITYRFLTKQSKKKLRSPHIEHLKEVIPYADMLKLLNHSEIILDIAKPYQNGLSFRIFEALGMNKKVITNNRSVMEYDFYNINNILVIDFDNLVIPKSFFGSPFHPIDAAIKQQYHLKSFVRTVVSNIKS